MRNKEENLKEFNYGYRPGQDLHCQYQVERIFDQVEILNDYFPGIGLADEKLTQTKLPAGAEGFFAIPRFESIADTYGEAVQTVFNKICEKYEKSYRFNFRNKRTDELSERYLRQSEKTQAFIARISNQQKDNPILVIPSQFGLRHAGLGVHRATSPIPIFADNEVGVGTFAAAIMLLTHAGRLSEYFQYGINCPGDEYAPAGDGIFSYTPYFYHHGLSVMFDPCFIGPSFTQYGSASMFELEELQG